MGDLLPTAADDPRLALRAADVERLSDDELYIELELGRPRVLSFDGRLDAAERWLAGEPGPESALARAAPARCRTCGFHVRLVGALGRVFGVCANEFAPDDSRVTSFDHGCGAHSEALVLPSVHPQPVRLDDDTELELVTPKTPDETRTEALAGASDDVPAAAPAGVVAQEPEDTLAAGPEVSNGARRAARGGARRVARSARGGAGSDGRPIGARRGRGGGGVRPFLTG